eukprot:scaffold201942_cov26-Prasinocladus_malaysianus.AAC.1
MSPGGAATLTAMLKTHPTADILRQVEFSGSSFSALHPMEADINSKQLQHAPAEKGQQPANRINSA